MKTAATKYLTPKEVSSILNISYNSALNFIKHSGISYIRIGHQYRVSPDTLKAFLQKNNSIEISAEWARNNAV